MALTEDNVRKRFDNLNSTQESIETVSLWCLHHKEHNAIIVDVWMKCFKIAPLKQRLALLYVVNDVCQKEKYKQLEYYQHAFGKVLKDAISLCRLDDISSNVERMLKIWTDRDIFTSSLLADLKANLITKPLNNGIVSSSADKESLIANFNLEYLIAELEKYVNENEIVECAEPSLPRLPFPECENLSLLKDRQEGLKCQSEIDSANVKLTKFIEDFERRLITRQKLVQLLEQADVFFEMQISEARIVEMAYRKFGNGVEKVREELSRMLGYPLSVNVPPSSQQTGSRTKQDSGPIDMEIEDDGIKITTNKSYVSSNESRSINNLLFGSSADKDSAKQHMTKNTSENRVATQGLRQSPSTGSNSFQSNDRQNNENKWISSSGSKSSMPIAPQPPPITSSRLQQPLPAPGTTIQEIGSRATFDPRVPTDPRNAAHHQLSQHGLNAAASATLSLPPPPTAPGTSLTPLSDGANHQNILSTTSGFCNPIMATNSTSQTDQQSSSTSTSQPYLMIRPPPHFISQPPPGPCPLSPSMGTMTGSPPTAHGVSSAVAPMNPYNNFYPQQYSAVEWGQMPPAYRFTPPTMLPNVMHSQPYLGNFQTQAPPPPLPRSLVGHNSTSTTVASNVAPTKITVVTSNPTPGASTLSNTFQYFQQAISPRATRLTPNIVSSSITIAQSTNRLSSTAAATSGGCGVNASNLAPIKTIASTTSQLQPVQSNLKDIAEPVVTANNNSKAPFDSDMRLELTPQTLRP